MPDPRETKSWLIVRNLVIAEVVAYLGFMALALTAYWAHLYRVYLPGLARLVSFTVIEFFFLGLVQIGVVVLVVRYSLRREISVPELVRTGEHEHLEFKSTMRWDIQRGQVNKDLERSVMKTIAAFLNSQGGALVIGVDDRQQPVGLGHDMRSLNKGDSDGFENHFNNVFNTMLGPEFRHYVSLSFHEMGPEQVCLVSVKAAAQPTYLKSDKGEEFFIRTGNATTALKLSQVAPYIANWHSR